LNYKFDLALNAPKFIHGATFIDNQYWISTPEGVVVLNNKGKFQTYFEDKSVSAVIKDRQNNYWFSTTNEGVFVVPDLMNTVHALNNIHPKKIVKLNNGNLLIGTKKGELVLASHDLTSFKTVYQSPNRNEIQYVYVDPSNQFVAFVSNRLTVLRAQDYAEIRNLNFSLKEICAIDSNYFAFAASGLYGVFKNPMNVSSQPSSWDDFLEQFKLSETFFWQFSINVRTRAVAFDEKSDALYYGTNIGLFRMTKAETQEIKIKAESIYASKIVTHNGDLYVLSTRGNLFKIKQNGDFELLNQRFDIPELEVKLVKRFDDILVFSSHNNVHSLDMNSGEHKVYRIDIAPYEINDFLLDDSYLFLITDEGVIRTEANLKASKDNRKPLFYINDFQIQNVSRNIGDKISVPFNQNQVSINFSILDFGKSQTAVLYQQLNNGSWELIPAETRSINFPNLAPGDYHLRFKLGGEIQEQDLKFTIRSPFWRTWWFILLIAVAALSLGTVYYFHKRRQLFKKLALLEEKIELEKNLSKSILTSIKAQMNPHFFYNALNTIQAYIFTNDPDNASKYLSKFSKLTRKILEMSETELVKLSEEIDTLTLYLELEQARFDDDFTFQIEVDKTIDLDMSRIPPMLIQPYVENAVKHGLLHKTGDKNVQIRFEKIDTYIQISIEDNGVGRRTSGELNSIKNAKHKSFATDANAKRLDVLNQGSGSKVTFEIIDKVDVNQVPSGTLVILKIPML
jgi:signal transduction histidine kinase